MSLKEKLAEDLKSSMKNKDTVRKNTVQLVRTAILQVEKDNKVTLDDEDILEVIAKQLKQRKDSLPEYEKSGREDLISQLKQEMECLMEYLPKQLTEDELRPIVEEGVKYIKMISANTTTLIINIMINSSNASIANIVPKQLSHALFDTIWRNSFQKFTVFSPKFFNVDTLRFMDSAANVGFHTAQLMNQATIFSIFSIIFIFSPSGHFCPKKLEQAALQLALSYLPLTVR